MSETLFYHLQTRTMEQALPQLLDASMGKGWSVVVKVGRPDGVEPLTDHLWTYDPHSFLPHGSPKDGNAASQPIWITDKDENPNQAQVLFLVEQAESDMLDQYERVCRLFNGNDQTAVQKARAAWKAEKDAGRSLTYWQQNEEGRWKKAADANPKEK